MKGLQDNLQNIDTIAKSNELAICSSAEDVVNTGFIIVRIISPRSNLMGMQLGLNELGFTTENFSDLGNGYIQYYINGYIRR